MRIRDYSRPVGRAARLSPRGVAALLGRSWLPLALRLWLRPHSRAKRSTQEVGAAAVVPPTLVHSGQRVGTPVTGSIQLEETWRQPRLRTKLAADVYSSPRCSLRGRSWQSVGDEAGGAPVLGGTACLNQ